MKFANHTPVMENQAVAALAPINHGIYVDATFGGGGYTRAILGAANCNVYGFDHDPTAIERAEKWAPAYGSRLRLVQRPFAEIETGLADHCETAIHGVVLDLGVSSMHLDEAARGFSFRTDGPLSMRMDNDPSKPDAADVVNRGEVSDLAAIFKAFGEERHAKKIARAIVKAREIDPIKSTGRLAEIISKAAPARPQDKIHPATRVFQALRIFVNDELGQLAKVLVAAERLLLPAGRLVVVTFHSLEDRIVKRFFADRCGTSAAPSRHAPPGKEITPAFRHLFAKAQIPSDQEIKDNPRARSAKLRGGVRLDTPARPEFDRFAPPTIFLSKALQHWSTT